MTNGIEYKVRIIRAGARVWQVAHRAGISPTRLSLILNNHVAPDVNEAVKVESAISYYESLNSREPGR